MASLPLLITLFVCILLPLAIVSRTAILNEETRSAWLLKVADGAAFLLFILLIGRWDIGGEYTRLAIVGLFAVAALFSCLRHRMRPWRVSSTQFFWRSHWSTGLSLAAFTGAVLYVGAGWLERPEARQIGLPLAEGRFMVVQGGGNLLLNYHASHPQQRYAADIVALHGSGWRSSDPLPESLADYAAYGATVVSPCAGTVTKVQSGLPDLDPPERDRANPSGNHVVIACQDILIELAHMQPESITVAMGDPVAEGAPLGRVGNSGNTTEPHLHVHAIDSLSGRAVPVSFDSKPPVRNRIYQR